jgi:hypothetical protein
MAYKTSAIIRTVNISSTGHISTASTLSILTFIHLQNYPMHKVMITLGLSLLTVAGRPQTVADLIEQLVLDKEKLTAMKGTLQDMYTGYETLKNGYTRVRDIAKANFSLHQVFLDGLWVLSPAVSGDPRISEILKMEYNIVAGYKTASARIRSSPVFTAPELGYILNTYSALLQHSIQAVEELTMILTDHQLQMSDVERLQAIDRIHTDVRGQYNAMVQLNNSLSVQAAQRQKETNDINTLKQLYGIH